jgi:flagellin
MMRADIATTLQGIRNAADAVSMIQTADGALGVIDAKLIRMKELAEQAATGTYTDFQREIINSEFQAMATEIDRIANATNFNGIRLLDGSTLNANGGQGIRIHFGVNNNAAEDYYYVSTGDVRATSPTGLGVGGDSTPDIWSTGGLPGAGYTNCCGGGFAALTTEITDVNKESAVILAYNWDLYPAAVADNGDSLITAGAMGTHIMGRYLDETNPLTLQGLVDAVNLGSQSRVQVFLSAGSIEDTGVICLGDTEAYYVGDDTDIVDALVPGATTRAVSEEVNATTATATAFAASINENSIDFWAIANGNYLWVFNKQGGDHNDIAIGFKSNGGTNVNDVVFTNAATGTPTTGGGQFSLGGEHWITAEASPETGGGFNLVLTGANAGEGYDIKVVGASDTTFLGYLQIAGAEAPASVASLTQVQDAADGRGSVRTQAAAQTALETINQAIERKDQVRASLGATQNRLEATIENLTIQAENLQASESRISDVDVATEMTEYTKNNILAQAAASMLAQANSLSSLALILLNG